jgi:hypothetical protein
MQRPTLRIRDFGAGVRLGLTILALVVLGGSAASGWYLREHHSNRDEREGFTLDDIRAHYHGIRSSAPMLAALRSGHPESLADPQRQALIDWLQGDSIREDYDNFDLGDMAPESIIAENCISCHAADATAPGADPTLSLRYFDEVMAVSVSREINPVGITVLAASLHAHSLGLASLTLITVLLLALTRLPSPLKGLIAVITAAGLFVDLAFWLITRHWEPGVYFIMGAGFAYQAGMILALLVVIADLWLPRAASPPAD